MLHRIMVPLDGSAFAEQALPLALVTARRARAELHLVLVRALLPLDTTRAPAEEYLDRIAGEIESELPGRLTRQVLTNELGPLEYPLQRDTIADVLARHAEALDIDLIVMTTHGRGGVRRAWLGSVADSLVRIAPRPVLLIRPKDEKFSSAADADRGVRHILVPLDGSERAELAFDYAQRLGEIFDARYTLLRVVSPFVYTPASEWYGAADPGPAALMNRGTAAEYLAEVADHMRDTGMDVTAYVAERVAPEAAIVEYASSHGVDLIVMSPSGASGVRRLLLGSVADKVVRSSDVPVLICNRRSSAAAAAGAGMENAALAGAG